MYLTTAYTFYYYYYYYTIYTITILYYTMSKRDDRIAASVIREAKTVPKSSEEVIPAIKAIVCRCGCDSCDGTEDCDCEDCCEDCACEA